MFRFVLEKLFTARLVLSFLDAVDGTFGLLAGSLMKSGSGTPGAKVRVCGDTLNMRHCRYDEFGYWLRFAVFSGGIFRQTFSSSTAKCDQVAVCILTKAA